MDLQLVNPLHQLTDFISCKIFDPPILQELFITQMNAISDLFIGR